MALSKFSASFLGSMQIEAAIQPSHLCNDVTLECARVIEEVGSEILTDFENYAVVYLGGWLEMKCSQLCFLEEEDRITTDDTFFLDLLSRGNLTVPHVSTVSIVKHGLCFVKRFSTKLCCRKQLEEVLHVMNDFYNFGEFNTVFFKRCSNVLLNGLHKLEKDSDRSSGSQTALKKARLSI